MGQTRQPLVVNNRVATARRREERRRQIPSMRLTAARAQSNFLQTHEELDTVVSGEHHRTANAAEELGDKSLVHTGRALVLHHLEEAVDAAGVKTLCSRLLGVEHHATANGVEWVVEWRGDGACHSSASERGDDAQHALVLLVWV